MSHQIVLLIALLVCSILHNLLSEAAVSTGTCLDPPHLASFWRLHLKPWDYLPVSLTQARTSLP